MDPNDEFYIGYMPEAPLRTGNFLRIRIAIGFFCLILVAGVLVAAQSGFAPSVFEFGNEKEFTGTLIADPHPRLLVDRSGTVADYSSYYLAGQFKFGADRETANYLNRRVSLKGTLIYLDGETMLELVPGSITVASGTSRSPGAGESLGQVVLAGEIVDSKCHLGVMNPGNLKAHRMCALRCVSGGLPPLLIVRSSSGETRRILLVSSNGEMVNRRVLNKLAVPVEIRGELVRYGEVYMLKAEPENYRLL